MISYREILRLNAQGISERSIALSCECSRNTVSQVIARASEHNVPWPLGSEMSDLDLEKKLFPEKASDTPTRKYPNYEYIDREMLRNGVTLKLLWNEYCEDCRRCKELPLMYSQFCFHYQKHTEKKRATMHIPRKPGVAQWKQATVQFNYHISVDKMQYSVPYEYIKQKVDIRLTRSIVEVFYNNTRICSHKRLYGYPGQYSTMEIHMPEDHQKYIRWNSRDIKAVWDF